MDDFNVTSLHESKNEWGARLLTILTPLVIEGFQSIYEESYSLCKSNNETEKHLMTFQNFISRIPKWNSNIVETEQKRIKEKSGCSYLEDLITCVHIIQLKLLTAVRVGSKQKKIDVKIPSISNFIHKVYITSARKIYKNVYLFERNITPLQIQKNARELEILIQESILNTIRDSIPVDILLRSYLDETTEEDIQTEIMEEEIAPPSVASDDLQLSTSETISPGLPVKKSLSFNDIDEMDSIPTKDTLQLPHQQKSLETEGSSLPVDNTTTNLASDKLNIGGDATSLTHEEVHSLDPPSVEVLPDLLIDDIEIL
tara:strand:+ start:4863 stop:5804 length:942 start_codon:yes stop_codon:yes gene_type:complete